MLIKSFVRESTPKCYKHATFLSSAHFMISGVTNTIRSISQGKQQINTSNKTVNPHTNTKSTKLFVNPQNTNKNGSFFSHRKQCLN